MSLEDRIYEAAFVPELWPDILHELAASIRAEGTLLASPTKPHLPYFVSDGVAELYRDFFTEGWAYNNARTHALVTIPHQGFMSDADHLSEEWMERQPIYRDFLWQRGFGYAAGTTINVPGGSLLGISIDKKRALGPVSQADLAFLDTMRPHLARAAMLGARFEFARIEASLQALQLVNLPAASIREDGKVLGCNALFENYSLHVTIDAKEKLRFHNAGANALFEKCLFMRRSGGPGARTRGHSFPLAATQAHPAAVIHLVPIEGVARDLFLRTAFFLIVTPVDRARTPSTEIIQGLFDLSPAEAKVGRKLAEGLTVREIAVDTGLAIETIQSQVKSLLTKSGLDRQTDFVAAISTIASVGP